jgi:predicted phosphodiesterase
MRIWTISDLQIPSHSADAWIAPENIPEADLAIVCGDFCPPIESSLLKLAEVAKRMPVVYVPGNRDFYQAGTNNLSMDDMLTVAYALGRDLGIKVLYNQSFEIGDVRVLGTTLWTDYNLYGDQEAAMDAARANMNDHRLIWNKNFRFTPGNALAEHNGAMEFLTYNLAVPFEGTTIVATHHAPHPNSIAPKYQGDPNSPCFASDLSDLLVSRHAPDVWVHGGLHHNVDYEIGRTRVLSNSHGYPGENKDFQMDLTIEVGERKPALTA